MYMPNNVRYFLLLNYCNVTWYDQHTVKIYV